MVRRTRRVSKNARKCGISGSHVTPLSLLAPPKSVRVDVITSATTPVCRASDPAGHVAGVTARLHDNRAHAEKQLSGSPSLGGCPSQWLWVPESLPSAAVLQDARRRPTSLSAIGVGGSESLTDSSLQACSEPYGGRLCIHTHTHN